jgi:predicted ATP-grasp superfamily ATP-dependent carboligase
MRIFVYEHLCATLATDHVALESLRIEGQAMLSAFAADFRSIPDVEIVVLKDGQAADFATIAARADYTLLIAPECDGILATLCRQVEQSGCRLLGPSAAAVRLAADKLELASFWKLRGVPTPPARLLLPQETPPHILWPAVVKPRHGAGSLATFRVDSTDEMMAAVAAARQEGCVDDLIVQPFAPGLPASVAWLIGPRQRLPLLPTVQELSADGRFHYRGGSLPLPTPLAERAARVSGQAVAPIPGLFGYVGVDLVLGAADDGSEDAVIELNPRPTTSYVGLRVAAHCNLAELLLRIARGEPTAPPCWHDRPVRFWADGRVEQA